MATLALAAALTFTPVAHDITPECAPGLIHAMPYCLSAEQFEAMWNPPTNSVPIANELVGEPLVRTIAYYYWPDWAAERMIRIARCESNYLPTAVNPRSGTTGIWQIHPLWQRPWPGDYTDPWTNGAVAYQVWLEQGFRAWVCRG